MSLDEIERKVCGLLKGVCDPDEKERVVGELDGIVQEARDSLKEKGGGPCEYNPAVTVATARRAGAVFTHLGERERALTALGIAIELYRMGARCTDIAEALKDRGRLLRVGAMWDEALENYEIGLVVYEDAGDSKGMADMHNAIGIINFERGAWGESEKHYHRALELIEDRHPLLRAKIHNNLGALYNARGDCDLAISSYMRSVPDFERTGNETGLAQAYHNLGMSFADKNDWNTAEGYYEKSLSISRRLKVPELASLTYLGLSDLYVRTSRLEHAEEYCRMAFTMLTDLDDKLGIAEAQKIFGIIDRHRRKWNSASDHFEKSIEMNEECSSPLGLAESYYEYGLMCRDSGRNEDAYNYLSRSLAIFEGLRASKDVENVRFEVRKIEDLYLNIIEALGTAVETKDPYTLGHSSRVAYYSLSLAERLSLTQDMGRGILIAAYLHDIGKIYVGHEILNKPGKLDHTEFETVKRHPEMGVTSLSAVEFPWEVKQYVLHHHERYDGTGYPAGLRGEEIPLGAQVIAVADFFDALTSHRSYRKAWSRDEALNILRTNRGVLFSERLVDEFVDLIEDGTISSDSSVKFSLASLWKRCKHLLPAEPQPAR